MDTKTTDTPTGETYPIRTLADIYNLPTYRQVKTCLEELTLGMLQARATNDLMVHVAGTMGTPVAKAFEWPEVNDWTDDGKGEVGTAYNGPDGKRLFTLKCNAEPPVDASAPECDCRQCIKEYELTGPDGLFPLNATRMIVCHKCGNKRCPKASDHRLECTGSNEPGQAGSIFSK